MNRPRLFAILGVMTVLLVIFFLLKKPANSTPSDNILIEVKESTMAINIHAPGELQARRSEKIKGPDGMRTVGLYQTTISTLVPEGTIVQKGQFIASLDRTELDGKIKEAQTEIDKITTQLDQARIDTAIEMRGLRDQVINVRFSMQEKEISLELSKYEPEAIKQQAKLDLERSSRELSQLDNKLKLTKEKSIAKIE
jgi:multidrug efflux pump subunit AcrA (membrane-fusion protein)